MDDKILETCVEDCDSAFDTFNGTKLKKKLSLINIPPPTTRGLFSGMFPWGNQWCVEFFTDDNSYSHKGGWCWGKGNSNTWATDVNEDLFNKREDAIRKDLYIRDLRGFGKAVHPKTNQYYYLSDGTKAVEGDIIKVEYNFNNGWRYETAIKYCLVYYSISCGGRLGNWHWNFTCMSEGDISNSSILKHGKIVPAKEGYYCLNQWAKKEWRKIHGVKGRPKFVS